MEEKITKITKYKINTLYKKNRNKERRNIALEKIKDY